jgi:hypothetical protein
MAQGTPQTFENVTPAQYALLVQKAEAAGIAISGASGSASKFGVELSWFYLPQKQQLSIQVLSTPFFMSVESVQSKITGLVQAAQA